MQSPCPTETKTISSSEKLLYADGSRQTDSASMHRYALTRPRYSRLSILIRAHSEAVSIIARYTNTRTGIPADVTRSEKYPPADTAELNPRMISERPSIIRIAKPGTAPAAIVMKRTIMQAGTMTDAMKITGIFINIERMFMRWKTRAVSGSIPAWTASAAASKSPA